MSAGFSHVPRRRGHNLCGEELERFVNELATRPELWVEHVKHDRTQRTYEELFSDEHVTAWLICWMEDHDTGFHDHDISCGAVAVVSGRVRGSASPSTARPPAKRSEPVRAFTSPQPTSTGCATPATGPR